MLPTTGITGAICGFTLIPDAIPRLIMVAGSCVVVLLGWLAWGNRSYAKLILAVPPPEPLPPVIEVEVDDGFGGRDYDEAAP